MASSSSLAAAFDHAMRLLQNNQPDAARYVFKQILGVVPEHPEVLHMLGVCDLFEGGAEDAAAHFQRSLAAGASDPALFNNMAVALGRLGRFDEAVDAARQALRLEPGNADALNNLGSALAELGRDEEALEAYAEAAARLPDNPDVQCNTAHIQLRLGQVREALDSYTRALTLDPQHAQAQGQLPMATHLAILSYFDPDSRYPLPAAYRESQTAYRDAVVDIDDCRFDQAAATLAALLGLHPEWWEVRALLGFVEYRRKRFAAGLDVLRHAPARFAEASLQAIFREYEGRLEAACRLPDLLQLVEEDTGPQPASRQPGDETVHLLCSFVQPAGTEMRCLDLARRMAGKAPLRIWSTDPRIHPAFAGEPIQLIGPESGAAPDGGTLVVVGAWHPVGAWYPAASFRRVVVIYNVDAPVHLKSALEALARPGGPRIEIVYNSDWMQEQAGLPGHFEPSPIGLERFPPKRPGEAQPSRFVVGRLSRDTPYKFHPGAPRFFATLAQQGISVRLMGATVLQDVLGDVQGVELLPANAESTADFLHSLDCFVYRTHSYFPEPWGRVLIEAMAVGLPVLAHVSAGAAQIIDHGHNGFLFQTDKEAQGIIARLQASPSLRQTVGQAARATVEAIFTEAAFDRYTRFYLG